MNTATAVAEQLYRALSDGDADALSAALSADFHATVSAGMPHDVGGEHHGRVAMITGVWGRIDAIYDLAVVPSEFLEIGGGNKVVVLGTYRGTARDGATRVDAAFAHVIAVRNGRITALQQITDTVRWSIPA